MKKLILLVLGLGGILFLKGKEKRSTRMSSNQNSRSLRPSELRIVELLNLYAQDAPEALFQSELLLDQLREVRDDEEQELRVRLLLAQSQMYFRAGDLATAVEKSQDAGAESWLLADDTLQKGLAVEIGRGYDTFVEAAVDKVNRKLASAERAMRDGKYDRAIELSENAQITARGFQIAQHPCASKAIALRGFAEYELGHYRAAFNALIAAKKQLIHYWMLMDPAYRLKLDKAIADCHQRL